MCYTLHLEHVGLLGQFVDVNDGASFETVVAQLVRHLDVFRPRRGLFRRSHVAVYQRKRYPGGKDLKGYEIDVSVEMTLPPGLRLLFIFECKYYSRLVDRSVIQEIIQVRDDISAHKAIVVSAKGFNSGAVRLAEGAGIGLWQVVNQKIIAVCEYPTHGIHFPWYDRPISILNALAPFFAESGLPLDLEQLCQEIRSSGDGTVFANVRFRWSSQDGYYVVPLAAASGSNFCSFETPYPETPQFLFVEWIAQIVLRRGDRWSDVLDNYLRRAGFLAYSTELKRSEGSYESLKAAIDALNSKELKPAIREMPVTPDYER